MRRSPTAIVLVIATAACLASPVAQAQEQPRGEDDPIEVPRIVIHGRRNVGDPAAPSTVIERGQVQDAVADLPEVLDEQPGLRTSRLGGLGSFSMLSIRGSTGDQVLVFLDGIPLNSAEGGPVDLSSIPLGPVRSIVVYRGVSPVVYGGSAIGGVVDIRTRDLDRTLLEVEAGGGSFGTRTARAFFGHGDARWGVGVSLDYLGSEGDFTFTNDGGTAYTTADDREVTRRNNAFDQVSAVAKGHVLLAKNLRLEVLDLFSFRLHGVPGLALYETEKSNLGALRNLCGLGLVASRLGTASGRLTVSTYLSWSNTRFEDPLDEVGLTTGSTDDTSLVPGVAVVAAVPIALGEDAAFVLTPTVQAEYRYERFAPGEKQAQEVAGGAGVSSRHLATAAAELSLVADPADLEAVASLRVEHVSSALSESPRFGLDDDLAGSAGDTALTYRLGLVQSSIPYTSVKANFSHSVRFPSLFELFGDTGYVLGNANLRPERGLNLDLGVLHTAGWLPEPGVWAVEIYGFLSFAEDLIQLIQTSQSVTTASNVDSALVAGVEIGTFLYVLRHLRVRGSLTFLYTEDTSAIAARTGKRLPYRPAWKSYARAEGYHRFGRRAVGEVGLFAEVEWLAGSYLDYANLVEVPSRLLFGLGLYATAWSDQLRADLTFRNLLGEPAQDLAGFPLPGLTVMATLRWTASFSSPPGGTGAEDAPPSPEAPPPAPRTPPPPEQG